MAFKRKYKNAKGNEKAVKNLTFDFADHLGHTHRLTGFPDRVSTDELKRKIERLVSLRMAGLGPDAELTRYLEVCPARIRDRLAEWHIIEATRAAAGKPFSSHIADWCISMKANGLSKKQIVGNSGKVERIVTESDWTTLSDITAEGMEKWRLTAKEGGMALMTTNHYLAAAKAFCNWLCEAKRLTATPLKHMRKLNAATDRRHERRAFDLNELGRILAAAKAGEYTHGLTGYERYLLYRIAVSTGYRWSEIKSFVKASINFASNPVALAIKAEDAKNGKDDAIPLPDDLAEELKAHLALHMPDAKIFPHMDDHGAEMLRVDLEAAGVPYIDEYGLVGDFHAFRHTFGTLGAKAGIPLAVMQKLMRHCDPKLTANLYTHILIDDKADALKKMPAIIPHRQDDEAGEKTGTDDAILVETDNITVSPTVRNKIDNMIICETYRDNAVEQEIEGYKNCETKQPLAMQGVNGGGERGIRILVYLIAMHHVSSVHH